MPHISDHNHPMHKGPHHNMYIHPHNRGGSGAKMGAKEEVVMGKKGSHEMGDKSHLSSVMGEPKGADVAGHSGKM